MILIVGGAGYIGSHVNKFLHQRGYETVVFDNLSRGHREAVQWGEFVYGDLDDRGALEQLFSKYPIDAVMDFSAFAYVGESVGKPLMYYQNNVANTLHLLEAMLKYGVRDFVFSSTCATYGEPDRMPITEDMPQRPVNPYGRSKLMMEDILADLRAAHGLRYAALRYFNAAGDDPDGEIGEVHRPETHLIPLILEAAACTRPEIAIFGTDYPTPDGTCIRDYVHVNDLADAHLRALQYIREQDTAVCLNLGQEHGFSVREMIAAAEKVTGRSIPVREAERRPGDPQELVGSYAKAKEYLGWEPRYSLEEIMRTAWKWQQKIPTLDWA